MAKKKPAAAERSKAVSSDKPTANPAKAEKETAGGTVYQLKIVLDDVRPPIWRRVQTKDCSLARLHAIIQRCMGWGDAHLHVFTIGGAEYGDPVQWPDDEMDDERKVKVSQFAGRGVKKIIYEYDMGDSWGHTIQVEKIVPAEPGVKYPRCIDGARACPPEDCGGLGGYENLLEALRNPQHAEHDEMLEWLGGDFDPEAFDVDEINQVLHER